MATKLDELLKIINEIIRLLESDGEQHWSNWMRQSSERLLNSDYSGIEHLLSAYGGMGSFNDLVICQDYENGQFRSKEGHVEKNNRLDELRSKAWELADAIRRNHNISNS
jgi:hypothetical protein